MALLDFSQQQVLLVGGPKRVACCLPIGRIAEPAEMAGAVLFLYSPLAAYVIGQTLIVDGGIMLLS
jgi:NAD(P)-dependent dehydrogenase (short-subunit alcohol dehydrogenase family)